MKLISYIRIAVVSTLSLPAIAQGSDTTLVINSRVTIGLRAGITQSSLRGEDIARLSSNGESSSLTGFHVGVAVQSRLSPHFGLRHELLAVQKNVGISLSDTINGSYSSDLKWWSIDLYPISPTWHYKGLKVFAGPYLSVLVDARVRRKDSHGQFESDYTIFGSGRNFQRQSNYMQKFDFGINVGAEYDFNNGISVSARYTRGYAELFDWSNSVTLGNKDTEISIYTDYLSFSIGYDFVRDNKEKRKR